VPLFLGAAMKTQFDFVQSTRFSIIAFVLGQSLFFQSCQQEQEFYKKIYLEQETEVKEEVKEQAEEEVAKEEDSPTETETEIAVAIENNGQNEIGNAKIPETIPATQEGSSVTNPGNENEPVVTPTPTVTHLPVKDYFRQNSAEENHKVDILWMVDNSGSMDDEQAALAYNFDVFIRNFLIRTIDFKMAIITTDGRDRYSGVMINPTDTLTSIQAASNEQQFISDFERYIQVGVNGSSNETGLKTSYSFFNRYTSFLRPDAYLIVVILSDEEDKSPLSTQEYTHFFQAQKSNPGMVKVYSIVNTQSICENTTSQYINYSSTSLYQNGGCLVESIDVGERYMEVSTATGGIISNIHDDFHQILSMMGGKIIDLTDSFALSKIPIDANNIVVRINDILVSAGWQYDSTSHTIKFNENSLPEEGAIISVEYFTNP